MEAVGRAVEQSAVRPIAEKIVRHFRGTVAPLNTTFPAIHKLLKILATIPITTCQCEKCISRLRIRKTYTRSTMTKERLSGLALLSIHRDIDLNVDDIINRFARKNERRMSLINISDTDLPEKQKSVN